jgi:hypothetical protein
MNLASLTHGPRMSLLGRIYKRSSMSSHCTYSLPSQYFYFSDCQLQILLLSSSSSIKLVISTEPRGAVAFIVIKPQTSIHVVPRHLKEKEKIDI